jgi:hypothetical protein
VLGRRYDAYELSDPVPGDYADDSDDVVCERVCEPDEYDSGDVGSVYDAGECRDGDEHGVEPA